MIVLSGIGASGLVSRVSPRCKTRQPSSRSHDSSNSPLMSRDSVYAGNVALILHCSMDTGLHCKVYSLYLPASYAERVIVRGKVSNVVTRFCSFRVNARYPHIRASG